MAIPSLAAALLKHNRNLKLNILWQIGVCFGWGVARNNSKSLPLYPCLILKAWAGHDFSRAFGVHLQVHSGSTPWGMVPPGYGRGVWVYSIFGAQGLVGADGQVHVSGSSLRHKHVQKLLVIVVDCGTFLAVCKAKFRLQSMNAQWMATTSGVFSVLDFWRFCFGMLKRIGFLDVDMMFKLSCLYFGDFVLVCWNVLDSWMLIWCLNWVVYILEILFWYVETYWILGCWYDV